MRTFPRLASLLIPAAIFGADWYVDDARPFDLWTRFADLALGGLLFVSFAAIARGHLRNAAVIIAAVLFSLAGAEAYARISLATGPTHIYTAGFQVADPVLGWRAGHAGVFRHTRLAETGTTIFDVAYTIDEQRNRHVISAEDGPTVAFFGDSFMFGEGLPDEDTLPQLFADLTEHRWRVLNLASSGYGPQQFLRALETGLFDSLLAQPRLFVFQTAPWHAERAACVPDFTMRAPRYILVDSRPQLRGICADRWSLVIGRLFTMSMYSVFLQPALAGATSERLELYIAMLVRAGEISREKYHVPTAILYLPDDAYLRGTGYSDEQIMQRLRDGGLVVIDGRLDPSAFPGAPLAIPGDGHPTGAANRARAALLYNGAAGPWSQARVPEAVPTK